MKCLIFAEISASGGTRSYLKDLLTLHSEKNIETKVVLPLSVGDNSIKSYIEESGATYHLVKDRQALHKKSYFSLIFEFRNYSNVISAFKPDIIVVSAGTPGENFFCFLQRIPSIYILHTYPGKVSLKASIMFAIPRFFARKANRIYTVSEYSKRMIVRHWKVNPSNIDIILNSYRVLPGKKCALSNKKIILTLGHVVEYKNPDTWLEVAFAITNLYDNVEFVWLGEGELLDMYRSLTKGNSQISFPGFRDNVEDYYSTSYLYFQPSRVENLSISILDALASGLPCVVSNVGGSPETIENDKSGFLCYTNSADEYIKLFTKLIDDEGLHNTMSLNATERAKKFNAEKQKQEIIELYEQILVGTV